MPLQSEASLKYDAQLLRDPQAIDELPTRVGVLRNVRVGRREWDIWRLVSVWGRNAFFKLGPLQTKYKIAYLIILNNLEKRRVPPTLNHVLTGLNLARINLWDVIIWAREAN